MNGNTHAIIEHLKSIDLAQYSHEDIKNCLRKIDNIGHITMNLNPNVRIFRARLNDSNNHFNSRSQLSYKPQSCNKTFQRASSPKRTMFYGSFFPDFMSFERVDPRLITSVEAVPWLRNNEPKGVKTITYSKWRVTKPLKFISIIQSDKFSNNSPVNKKLNSDYNSFIAGAREEIESKLFTSFIADEFAKDNITDHTDYKISAAFSELAVKNGFDGVIYPSVRMNGEYLNIAICPQKVDTSLALELVVECTIYKNGLATAIDNEYQSVMFPNPKNFSLNIIDNPNEHAGLFNCLGQIGVRSLDEITNG